MTRVVESEVRSRLGRIFGLMLVWVVIGLMALPTNLALASTEFATNTHQFAMTQAIAPLKQSPDEVSIHLGSSAGELTFEPAELSFEAGKRYKLVLDNPSSQKHYFTAKDFADAIWTQKVEAGAVEVKGAIHEVELKPGGEAEWVFIPLKTGTYTLYCSIAGHREAGMTGTLTVSAP